MASASVDSPSSPAPEGEKLISIAILQIVREKQQVNGLKNGNYIRYHHYCTRKLKKLRTKLDLTLTTGGKFVKRDFTSVQNYFEQLTQFHAEKKTKPVIDTQLRSSQLLQLLVFQAERAWSHAMQLKQDIAQKDIKRKRHHHLRRLGKAVRISAKLDKLCKESADKRTQLESEAYHAWMSGNLLLANKQWQEALEKFIQARTIYDNLSKIGRAAIKETYTQRVEEIDTSIRFCHYSISKGKGTTSDVDIVTLIDSSDDPALDLLKSKLQDVLEETRKTQAKTMDEIEWSGKRIAIENDKIRIAMVQAESIKNEINNCKSVDAKFRLYDKLFIALSDCQKLIRDDLKTNVNKNDERFIANMRILHAFLTTMQLERTIERNMLMVANTIEKLNEDSEENKKKGGSKKASPLDVVRLYEVVLQNISDLKEIPGVEDNEKLVSQLDAKASLYKAARCFYLGKEHANSAQWKEAFALYERSEKLSEQSKPQLSKQNLKDEQNELLNIQKNIREAKCVAKAQYILSKAKQKQRDEDMFEQRTTTTTEKPATKEKIDILHRLDDFTIERKGKPFLVAFPPNFEAIPTKPTFFDIASNSIKYPDLSDKVAKKKWFGFW